VASHCNEKASVNQHRDGPADGRASPASQVDGAGGNLAKLSPDQFAPRPTLLMAGKPRILLAVFAYNEGSKIQRTLSRVPAERDYDLLVLDDGSTDGSLNDVSASGARVLRNPVNAGVGASMKRVFDYALDEDYAILAIMAGNDKDEPNEIPRLLEPVLSDEWDFVQGSRFLSGGGYGRMPFYRTVATRLHPLLFSLLARRRVTESTNGFRAFRTALLRDARIDWRQDWLNKYELEPYLLFKAYRLGYRVKEVPVTKIYPPKSLGYTKMKPFSGWWSILRPVVLLGLGLKK
jgi:dolichol-phosphate mannosyltransferase